MTLMTIGRAMLVNKDLTSKDTKWCPWVNNSGGMVWILVTASKESFSEDSFCAKGEWSEDRYLATG